MIIVVDTRAKHTSYSGANDQTILLWVYQYFYFNDKQ